MKRFIAAVIKTANHGASAGSNFPIYLAVDAVLCLRKGLGNDYLVVVKPDHLNPIRDGLGLSNSKIESITTSGNALEGVM
jgi:hypothetical protein